MQKVTKIARQRNNPKTLYVHRGRPCSLHCPVANAGTNAERIARSIDHECTAAEAAGTVLRVYQAVDTVLRVHQAAGTVTWVSQGTDTVPLGYRTFAYEGSGSEDP